MKVQIQPVADPLFNVTIGFVEIFDPRVIPARPAIPYQPGLAPDPSKGFMGRPETPAVPAYPGSVSCIVRFYTTDNVMHGNPLRNQKTELSPEQYAAWDGSVADDDAYFADCILKNLGLAKAA